MADWRYAYLLSSLPDMPSLRYARALPIGEQRLRQRLKPLAPADARVLSEVEEIVSWRHQRPADPDALQIARLADAAGRHRVRAVRDIAGFRLETRTIVAALRYRRSGAAKMHSALVGAAPVAATIARRWNDPDFGLAAIHPWIGEVRRGMEAGDWIGVERVLLQRAWSQLCAVDQRHNYALENVIAWVLRWDVLSRWLAVDAALATARFTTLLDEALGGTLDGVA